jgi:hypothetical protein
MIPKSGNRFSEKIMRKQMARWVEPKRNPPICPWQSSDGFRWAVIGPAISGQTGWLEPSHNIPYQRPNLAFN